MICPKSQRKIGTFLEVFPQATILRMDSKIDYYVQIPTAHSFCRGTAFKTGYYPNLLIECQESG